MASMRLVAADDIIVHSRAFEERLKVTDRPRQRANLETFLEHIRTEAALDIEGVMRTFGDEPEFLNPHGPSPKGLEEVRAFYVDLFERGGIGNSSMEVHRLVVDDESMVNEFTYTVLLPWQMAKEQGYDIPEERGHYAVSRRMCGLKPFDDRGRMGGEFTYAGPAHTARCELVPDDELSPGYLSWVERFGTVKR